MRTISAFRCLRTSLLSQVCLYPHCREAAGTQAAVQPCAVMVASWAAQGAWAAFASSAALLRTRLAVETALLLAAHTLLAARTASAGLRTASAGLVRSPAAFALLHTVPIVGTHSWRARHSPEARQNDAALLAACTHADIAAEVGTASLALTGSAE